MRKSSRYLQESLRRGTRPAQCWRLAWRIAASHWCDKWGERCWLGRHLLCLFGVAVGGLWWDLFRFCQDLVKLPMITISFEKKGMSMRPSVVLDSNRGAVREAVSRFRTTNPRVFGSVLHGTDRDGSDIDWLVDTLPGATLLDLGDLEEAMKSLLGVDVDLLTPGDLPPKFRAQVLAQAQPV